MSYNLTELKLIPYLSENYEKEKWLRMYWAELHKNELERAATLQREPTNYEQINISEHLCIAGIPTLFRDHSANAKNKKTVPMKDICFVTLGKANEPEPPMKPVPEELKEILFDSYKAYLKIRKLTPPDKKYNFIECENWKYGWEVDEKHFNLRGPAHGKKFYLKRMKGIGPQPDPIHYLQCRDPTSSLCNEI